mmetsp:Transcript_20091/g.35833  ORF Transcript_20091/g.35833 Transcript_20091/m.35833 type:complete len:168 (+) Transcript_20091:15-518(+)
MHPPPPPPPTKPTKTTSLTRQSSSDQGGSRGSSSTNTRPRATKRKMTTEEMRAQEKIERDRKTMKLQRLESCLRSKDEPREAEFEEMWDSVMKKKDFSVHSFWKLWENDCGRNWRTKFAVTPQEMREYEREYQVFSPFQEQSLRRNSSSRRISGAGAGGVGAENGAR